MNLAIINYTAINTCVTKSFHTTPVISLEGKNPEIITVPKIFTVKAFNICCQIAL